MNTCVEILTGSVKSSVSCTVYNVAKAKQSQKTVVHGY